MASVQLGYDLHTPNHTQGNVNIGYGLVATPVHKAKCNKRGKYLKMQLH